MWASVFYSCNARVLARLICGHLDIRIFDSKDLLALAW